MNKDKYGYVINGEKTYKRIAKMLMYNDPILISWTDEQGSAVDFLFVYRALTNHEDIQLLQGGIKADDLFVSIMRRGAFGFDVEHTDTHGTYYAEKLNLEGWGSTIDKVASLINGTKKEINLVKKQK